MTIKRKFERVLARKLRFSNILPGRSCYDDDIFKSMKRDGVQQPLIVRPHPNIPEEYEIIDGFMRYWTFKPDDLVLVDVRYGVEDPEVFKISDITFRRKQRTTYQRAEFFASWVRVESKHGKRGAQARVAEQARLTEGEVSQYLAICRMFTNLKDMIGQTSKTFNALKNQGINKLYELSRLIRTPVFLKVAVQLAENPSMPVRELRRILEEETSIEKTLQQFADEDPFETEDSQKTDFAEIDKLAQEMLNMTENVTKSVKRFETRVKQAQPESFLKDEMLKELRKLRRRFRRLQKDVAKLPDLVATRASRR